MHGLKAKYAVPRHPELKTCYRSNKLARPRLKIPGVWCFNYSLRIGVLDETVRHGSSMVVEILMMGIEDTMRICRENKPCPDCLVVVGDNTVKELKNNICFSAFCNWVAHRRFRLLAYKSF